MLFNKKFNFNYQYILWSAFIVLLLIGLLLFIFDSINITSKAYQNVFAYTVKVQSAYEKIDSIFERAEVNVNVLVDSISSSYNINKQQDRDYNLQYIKSIDDLIRSVLMNSPGVNGCWFQLNANLPFSLQAYNWYEFRDDQFINLRDAFANTPSMNRKLSPEDDPYYFGALNSPRPSWSEVYKDADIGNFMVTISAPIYKENLLVGVVGIDISIDNLQQALRDMQLILNESELYLLDKRDKVVLSQLFSNSQAPNYAFINLFKENNDVAIHFNDNLTKKSAVELTLSSGYKIVIAIKDKTLFGDLNRIFNTIYFLFALVVILAIAVFIKHFKSIELFIAAKEEQEASSEEVEDTSSEN